MEHFNKQVYGQPNGAFSISWKNKLVYGCKKWPIFTRIKNFQSGVRLVRGTVKDVQPKKIVLSDGTDVPYGLLVWSTGVGPSTFVQKTDLPKAPGGR